MLLLMTKFNCNNFARQSRTTFPARVALRHPAFTLHTFLSCQIWRFDSQSPYLKSVQQAKISAAYHFSSVDEK